MIENTSKISHTVNVRTFIILNYKLLQPLSITVYFSVIVTIKTTGVHTEMWIYV